MPAPRLARLFRARAQSPDHPLARTILRLLPYLLVLAALVVVMACGSKFWQTNDDEHMAMIAHGYGLSDAASPGLVFSNVIWGWIVMHLSIGGLQGYTVGQYAAVWLAFLALCYSLHRCRAPGFLAAAALLAAFVPTLLDMQFSITAGLLTVAGLALVLCDRDRGWWSWSAAAALLLLAALIRLNEFLLVLAVTSPFCAWRLLREADRAERLRWAGMLAALAVAIGACTAVDRAYYSGPEWDRFHEAYELAQPFTDFGLANYYLKHVGQSKRVGLTANDTHMIGLRFFIDENYINPAHLRPLIDNYTVANRIRFNSHRWHDASRPFRRGDARLLLLVFAVAVFACRRVMPGVAAGLLFAAVTVLFWLMGRPGIVHINLPVMVGLACLAMISVEARRHWLFQVAGIAILALAVSFAHRSFASHELEGRNAVRQAGHACLLPADQLFVLWGGGALNERAVYRPTVPDGHACNLKLYILGGLEYLPADVELLHGYTHGKSLIQALLDGQSIYFVSFQNRMKMLQHYMKQHYQVQLGVEPITTVPGVRQFLVKIER